MIPVEVSTPSVVIAMMGAYLLVAALPGANFLVVSQIGLTMSRAHAICAAIGVAGGAAALSALALSAGQTLASFDEIVWALNLCFVLILGYMGIKLLIVGAMTAGRARTVVMSRLACFRLGLVTAATNPVTAAFFLTMVAAPNCRAGTCGPLVGAIAVFTVASVWYCAVALMFSGARLHRLHTQIRPWLNVGLGAAFLLLASNAYMSISG